MLGVLWNLLRPLGSLAPCYVTQLVLIKARELGGALVARSVARSVVFSILDVETRQARALSVLLGVANGVGEGEGDSGGWIDGAHEELGRYWVILVEGIEQGVWPYLAVSSVPLTRSSRERGHH